MQCHDIFGVRCLFFSPGHIEEQSGEAERAHECLDLHLHSPESLCLFITVEILVRVFVVFVSPFASVHVLGSASGYELMSAIPTKSSPLLSWAIDKFLDVS